MKDLWVGAILLVAWAMLWQAMGDWPDHASGFVKLLLIVATSLTVLFILQAIWHLTALRLVSMGQSLDDQSVVRRLAAMTSARTRENLGAASGVTSVPGAKFSARRIAVFGAASLIYVASITTVGYLVSTLLFGLFTLGRVFRWRLIPLGVTTALIVGLHFLATNEMSLRLPEGWFV